MPPVDLKKMILGVLADGPNNRLAIHGQLTWEWPDLNDDIGKTLDEMSERGEITRVDFKDCFVGTRHELLFHPESAPKIFPANKPELVN
jgi:hypothetical protein